MEENSCIEFVFKVRVTSAYHSFLVRYFYLLYYTLYLNYLKSLQTVTPTLPVKLVIGGANFLTVI